MIDQLKEYRAESDVDQIVHEAFFSSPRTGRICVEVGAARPDYLSVGSHFRSLGWRVLSIEPNPEFCAMHRKKGHEVYEYACADSDRDDADFYVVDSKGVEYHDGQVSFESFSSLGIRDGFVKLSEGLDFGVKKVSVKIRRLDTILQTHAPQVGRIDLLVVDVEGWELEVLRGLDFIWHRPRVMVIENFFDDARYRDHMKGLGYDLWRYLPPNEVWVSRARPIVRIQRWLRSLSRLFDNRRPLVRKA